MPQNRPGIIKRFIGIASNTITHKILIRTEDDENIRRHYESEINRDAEVATRYREKISPASTTLPSKDHEVIKKKIEQKVKSEIQKRINKGYDIDITLTDEEINKFLKEQKII